MTETLTGVVKTWEFRKNVRKFGEVTLSYDKASKLCAAVPYNATSGRGEQRNIDPSNIRNLLLAIVDGSYTPAPGALGLRAKHKEALKLATGPDGVETFSLVVSEKDKLPLTDANHRMETVGLLLKEARAKLAKATTEEEKAEWEGEERQLLNLPFTFTVYFDGNPQEDFISLQKGRAVDRTHLFSMEVKAKKFADPAYKFGHDIAKLLHSLDGSPYQNIIRFDSRAKLPLPVTTLCSRGASDLATSLIGLAKVAVGAGEKMNPLQVAHTLVSLYKRLKEKAPDVLSGRKALTPIGDGGTKGAATMLLAVAACVVYKTARAGDTIPSEATLDLAVKTAKSVLDETMSGGFSGAQKRLLAGNFARVFFAGDSDLHEGVPAALVKLLSPSTLNVGPLPKVKPEPKPVETPAPKKAVKKVAVDVDAPLEEPAAAPELSLVAQDEDEDGEQESFSPTDPDA